jgi:hypothetical protein
MVGKRLRLGHAFSFGKVSPQVDAAIDLPTQKIIGYNDAHHA